MNAYECKGKFLEDGHIDIPLEIKKKLKNNQEIKLIILTEEDEVNEIELVEEMKGAYKGLLSSSEEFSKAKKQEKVLEERKLNYE